MVLTGLPGPDKQVGRVLWSMGTIRALFPSGFKTQLARGRNSRFPMTVQEYDRSADILVRSDHAGKPQADKNVRAPIT
jgi:hypothetical protein